MSPSPPLFSRDRSSSGEPLRFAGTDVPVARLFEDLAAGRSLDDFLGANPTVSRELAIAALGAASGALATDWSCATCRAPVPCDFDACWRCGTTRDGTPDPAFMAEAGQVLERHCQSCGYELAGSERIGICPECGNRFDRRSIDTLPSVRRSGPDPGSLLPNWFQIWVQRLRGTALPWFFVLSILLGLFGFPLCLQFATESTIAPMVIFFPYALIIGGAIGAESDELAWTTTISVALLQYPLYVLLLARTYHISRRRGWFAIGIAHALGVGSALAIMLAL